MNQQSDHSAQGAQDLRSLMKREISFMRELLASMEQEHQAILSSDVKRLKTIISARDPLLEALNDVRNDRIDALRQLHGVDNDTATKKDLTEEDCHALLTQFADNECCEILLLRDQMLALLERMTAQNSRNNYLLKAKINTTRELIHRLHPDDPHKTYSGEGKVQPKTKVATVAIINQEV